MYGYHRNHIFFLEMTSVSRNQNAIFHSFYHTEKWCGEVETLLREFFFIFSFRDNGTSPFFQLYSFTAFSRASLDTLHRKTD